MNKLLMIAILVFAPFFVFGENEAKQTDDDVVWFEFSQQEALELELQELEEAMIRLQKLQEHQNTYQ